MRDGPVLRAVKALARASYHIDLALARAFLRGRGRLPYRLGGSCRGCGDCCVEPSIRIPRFYDRLRSLRRLLLTWHRIINGFDHRRTEHGPTTWIFHCTHYDPETRLCDSYSSRPGMCRDYPRLLLHAPTPELLDGCTHRAVHARATQTREALARLDLPQEKIEELRRNLNLDAEDPLED